MALIWQRNCPSCDGRACDHCQGGGSITKTSGQRQDGVCENYIPLLWSNFSWVYSHREKTQRIRKGFPPSSMCQISHCTLRNQRGYQEKHPGIYQVSQQLPQNCVRGVTFRKTGHLDVGHTLILRSVVWSEKSAAFGWKITFPTRPQAAFLWAIHNPLSSQVALVCHNRLPLCYASCGYVNKLSMFNSQASTVTRCRICLRNTQGLPTRTNSEMGIDISKRNKSEYSAPWYETYPGIIYTNII